MTGNSAEPNLLHIDYLLTCQPVNFNEVEQIVNVLDVVCEDDNVPSGLLNKMCVPEARIAPKIHI